MDLETLFRYLNGILNCSVEFTTNVLLEVGYILIIKKYDVALFLLYLCIVKTYKLLS